MPLLNQNQTVTATFTTIGLDRNRFTSRQTAIVVSHKRQGWLILRFKTGKEYQYRVHAEDGMYKNWTTEKIFIEVQP